MGRMRSVPAGVVRAATLPGVCHMLLAELTNQGIPSSPPGSSHPRVKQVSLTCSEQVPNTNAISLGWRDMLLPYRI